MVLLATVPVILAPVQLITTQVGIYLALAGACNLAVVTLALRGLDFDDPFDNPLVARSPGEFWGRRWNTWVNHMLYRYVFVPSGGWRRPVRGTLAAFPVSGALHEGFVVVGARVHRLDGRLLSGPGRAGGGDLSIAMVPSARPACSCPHLGLHARGRAHHRGHARPGRRWHRPVGGVASLLPIADRSSAEP